MVGPDRRAVIGGGAVAALSACSAAPPVRRPASAEPRRIVSLNACLDVILVAVAERERIAALSHWSRDPYGSTIAEVARTLPITHGSAEEVLALEPDLVLNAGRSAPATRRALERLGVPMGLFDVPETIAASLAQVRGVAALVGRAGQGDALAMRIEAAIAASAPPQGTPPVRALVFMPGGFASGPGTLMDEMMTRAGLENAAPRYGLAGSASVPLERLIADPPQLLLSGEPLPGAASRAERLLQHPALARIAPRIRRATFPERLLFCGGPVLIRTAETLARARATALERRA